MVFNKMIDKKRHITQKKYICIIILLVVAIVLTSCYAYHEKKFYSDISNFITLEAIVNNIIHEENDNCIILWLDGIDEYCSAPNFIIRDDNYSLALKNGFLNKVKIGDTIRFTSAPRIFGNGYFIPIVGIEFNGDIILDFESGYRNLMDSYS